MVASHGNETGQQIKLLATFMQLNLLKKGMVSFLGMMGFCYDTLPDMSHKVLIPYVRVQSFLQATADPVVNLKLLNEAQYQ